MAAPHTAPLEATTGFAHLTEPTDVAEAAGLRYVEGEVAGIGRRGQGRGFSYRQPDGTVVQGAERERIEALAIPPAWTEVWIAPWPDAHVLATGRDDAGRKQYLYHPRWRAVRDAAKYEHLAEFGRALPDLRGKVAADLRLRSLSKDRVLAAVLRLMDLTLVRVGNDEYAADNETFGATTLRPDHVALGSTVADLRFPAKGGIDRHLKVHDRPLLSVMEQCLDLGGPDLFCWDDGGRVVDVTSDDVNAYLRAVVGDTFSAKFLRTWGGTTVAGEGLLGVEHSADEVALDAQVLAAFDAAAERLGNTRAVCRACYVAPQVPAAHREGLLRELWRGTRAGRSLSRAERTVARTLDEVPVGTVIDFADAA